MDRMLTRMLRQAIFGAIDKGVDASAEYMSRRQSPDGKARDLTPEQRKQVKATSRNARKAMRMARRLGRF